MLFSQPRAVTVVSRDIFRIALPTALELESVSTSAAAAAASATPKYIRGGYFREVKQPFTVRCKTFAESLLDPAHTLNFCNFNRPTTLHVLMRALWAFAEKR